MARLTGDLPKLETLHEDDLLRLAGWGPLFDADRGQAAGGLSISFTGIGGGAGGIQKEEFLRTAAQGDRSVLFVTDKARSWFNAPSLYESILERTAAWVEAASDVVTLGNSMGGFGCLLFAAPMRARVALAFGPQISISRRVIPSEKRWSEHTSKIETIRFEDVNDAMTDGPTYVIVQGSGGKDAHQIEAVRPRPNLRHYVVPHARHNIGVVLKDAGALAPLVAAANAGDWATFDRVARQGGAAPRAEVGPVLEHLQARRDQRRAKQSAAN